jgi:hypothetical protein
MKYFKDLNTQPRDCTGSIPELENYIRKDTIEDYKMVLDRLPDEDIYSNYRENHYLN